VWDRVFDPVSGAKLRSAFAGEAAQENCMN